MGCSFLFAVFDSHDHIHWGVEGLDTRDRRLPPQGRARAHRPAGRPARLRLGSRHSSGCRRARAGSTATAPRSSALVERAAGLGYEFKAGLELEWFIGEDSDEPVAAHRGPGLQPERDARRERVPLGAARRPRRQRARHRPDPRRVRLVATRDLARRQGSAARGRQSAARARDDPHRRPRQRAARLLRAARSRPTASATAGTSTSRSTRTAATCCPAATGPRA